MWDWLSRCLFHFVCSTCSFPTARELHLRCGSHFGQSHPNAIMYHSIWLIFVLTPCETSYVQYLSVSNVSWLVLPLLSRYFSVMLWKFSDTDPKQTSGLNEPSEGSGQREDFLLYLDLPASSRDCHCCTSCGGSTVKVTAQWRYAEDKDWHSVALYLIVY